MTARIDAHQHFWTLQRGDYGWLTPSLAPIYRDFHPSDIEPLLKRAGIGATILVQAAPTESETRYLLSLAAMHPWIAGVVGWTDFEAANADSRISILATEEKLVGLRPMVHDIADAEWLLRNDVEHALNAMRRSGLVFDALVRPPHLATLFELAKRHHDLTIVIDHGAKPEIASNGMRSWEREMRALAAETRVWCKLSGLVTEARADWCVADLKPYVEVLLDAFGPGRLIWGSDWPVLGLASTYERWVDATDELLIGLSEPERSLILGGNACSVYGIYEISDRGALCAP